MLTTHVPLHTCDTNGSVASVALLTFHSTHHILYLCFLLHRFTVSQLWFIERCRDLEKEKKDMKHSRDEARSKISKLREVRDEMRSLTLDLCKKIQSNEKVFEAAKAENETLRTAKNKLVGLLKDSRSRSKRTQAEEERLEASYVEANTRVETLEKKAVEADQMWREREAAWIKSNTQLLSEARDETVCENKRANKLERSLQDLERTAAQLSARLEEVRTQLEKEQQDAAAAKDEYHTSLRSSRDETAQQRARKQAGDDQLAKLEETILAQHKKVEMFSKST